MASPAVPGFPPDTLLRLVAALVADERGRQRGRPLGPVDWAGWTADTRLDEDGVGADSLARLELVGRVNRFFHMHETGAEDYLVVRPTLGDWAAVAASSLALKAERLTFQTSGSSGAPSEVTHRLADLADEIIAQAGLFRDVGRVVALVPPHHIYGFLFTAFGPALRGLPVLDARAMGPGRVVATARAGDLIVATPFLWDMLLRAGARFAPGVRGVTSGAPAPASLWGALAGRGLSRLVEIYGATETAGMGWRAAPGAPFAPLDHLRAENGRLVRRRDGAPLDPPDRLDWVGPGAFRPAGRLDGAVQVGGVNVFRERVRETLRDHPDVADAAVRLDGEGAAARLKAYVAPRAGVDGARLAEALPDWCAARLTPPERPARFAHGPALPRDAVGKLRDWA